MTSSAADRPNGVRGLLVVAVLCAATLIGCGSTTPGVAANGKPAATREPEEILRQRPPFEAAKQQYMAAAAEISNQIAALRPGLTWQLDENSWGGCGGDFVDTNGVQAYVRVVFSGPTPDPLWPRAVQIVRGAAAGLGATTVKSLVDKPANHDLVITGPEGINVHFGTAVATVLSMTSDCRLRQN